MRLISPPETFFVLVSHFIHCQKDIYYNVTCSTLTIFVGLRPMLSCFSFATCLRTRRVQLALLGVLEHADSRMTLNVIACFVRLLNVV